MSQLDTAVTFDIGEFVANLRRMNTFTEEQIGNLAQKAYSHNLRVQGEARKAASAAAKEAKDSIKQVQDGVKVLETTSRALGGTFGGLTGPLGDVSDLLDVVEPKTAGAAVAFGAVGAAILAVGVNAVEIISNLEDYRVELGTDINVMEDARDAGVYLSDAWIDLRVQAAVPLAGAMRDVADGTSYMLSIGDDYVLWIGRAIAATAGWIGENTHTGLVLRAMAAQGRAAREEVEALTRAQEALAQVRREEAEMAASLGMPTGDSELDKATVDARTKRRADERRRESDRAAEDRRREAERAAEDMRRSMEQLTQLHTAASEKMLSEEDRIYARLERDVAQVRELAGLTEEYALAQETIVALTAESLQNVSDLHEKARGEADRRRSQELAAVEQHAQALASAAATAFKELDKEMQRISEQERNTVTRIVSSAETITSQLFQVVDAVNQAVLSSFDTTTEEGKAAYLEAWHNTQAAAAAQAAINTFLAISSALTLPWPANVPAVIAAGVSGVAQEIAIATAPPPVLHSGLQMPASTAASDEYFAKLRRGEMLLPSSTVARVGGAREVRDRLRDFRQPQQLVARFDDDRVMVPLARAVGRRTPNPYAQWAAA